MKETASKADIAASVVEPEACKYILNRSELEKNCQKPTRLTHFLHAKGLLQGIHQFTSKE